MTDDQKRERAGTPFDQAICWILAFIILSHAVVYQFALLSITLRLAILIASILIWLAMPFWWSRPTWKTKLGLCVALCLIASVTWIPFLRTGDILVPPPALFIFVATYTFLLSLSVFYFARVALRIGLVLSALTTIATMLGLVSLLPSQPPLHYTSGGTYFVESMGYSIKPYSQAIQFFPSNGRAQFTDSGPRTINPWLVWQLIKNDAELIPGSVLFGSDGKATVRITLSGGGTADLWNTTWSNFNISFKKDTDYKVTFKARASAQRAVKFTVAKQNPYTIVTEEALIIDNSLKDFTFSFHIKDDLQTASMSFSLGEPAGWIEFDDLLVTQNDVPLPANKHLSRYSVDYTCNKLGFRDRDYTIPKPPGVFRIVCLGDSLTWGQGVRYQDTYSKVLEQMLNGSKESGVRFEVVNCGRCGYSTKEERACYLELARQYEPDVVILQMCDNDNEQQIAAPDRVESYDTNRSYKECADELVQLNKDCHEFHSRLVVMYFRYGALNRPWRRLQAEVSSHAVTPDWLILDTGEQLSRRPQQSWLGTDLWVGTFVDAHPNEIAHRSAAQQLADFLRKSALLPSAALNLGVDKH